MAIDPVYLCKDCKHCKMDTFSWLTSLGGRVGAKDYMFKCAKTVQPAKEVINPVYGPEKIKKKMSYCDYERKREAGCGPEAKYWTPKHKKDLFKMLTKEHSNAD